MRVRPNLSYLQTSGKCLRQVQAGLVSQQAQGECFLPCVKVVTSLCIKGAVSEYESGQLDSFQEIA